MNWAYVQQRRKMISQERRDVSILQNYSSRIEQKHKVSLQYASGDLFRVHRVPSHPQKPPQLHAHISNRYLNNFLTLPPQYSWNHTDPYPSSVPHTNITAPHSASTSKTSSSNPPPTHAISSQPQSPTAHPMSSPTYIADRVNIAVLLLAAEPLMKVIEARAQSFWISLGGSFPLVAAVARFLRRDCQLRCGDRCGWGIWWGRAYVADGVGESAGCCIAAEALVERAEDGAEGLGGGG
jgi:hypothetical protein